MPRGADNPSATRPAFELSVRLVASMERLLYDETRRRAQLVPIGDDVLPLQYDSDSHHYAPRVGDVLRGDGDKRSYVVRGVLGGGTFGVVVRCLDLSSRNVVAIKVIATREEIARQGQKELLTLQWLRYFAERAIAHEAQARNADVDDDSKHFHTKNISEWSSSKAENDDDDAVSSILCDSKWARDIGASTTIARILAHSICHIQDAFACTSGGHLCFVFPLLSVSLYDVLKKSKFSGLSIRFVRKVALQLAHVLYVLRYALPYPLIHCDIKPENILLRHQTRSGVVLIDFGSSFLHCEEEQKGTYVQSRYYRAPEVVLNAGYACPADAWSLGATLFELVVGDPIFPGRSESHQLHLFERLLGRVPDSLLSSCRRRERFYERRVEEGGSEEAGRWVLRSVENCRPAVAGSGGYFLPLAVSMPSSAASSAAAATVPRSKVAATLVKALHDHTERIGQPNKKSRTESSVAVPIADEVANFADFVAGLLRYDPDERLTPRQMLHHPFLKKIK